MGNESKRLANICRYVHYFKLSYAVSDRKVSSVITLGQYFAAKPHNADEYLRATDLLMKVNRLIGIAPFQIPNCPNTGTQISGSKNGAGDGGFRLSASTTGAARSSHKEARAVDVYDPLNKLDEWITDAILTDVGLYRETPSATPNWCHLTTRKPSSGNRTFMI